MTRSLGGLLLVALISLPLGIRAGQTRSIELPPDNAMAQLVPGTGVEVVRANCISCHSTDYIVRQPPSDSKRWAGEVQKMIGVYGAHITKEDAKIIINYLTDVYGHARPGEAQKETAEKATSKTR